MNEKKLQLNWEKTINLIGYSSIYPDVANLIFEELEIKQQLVKIYDRTLKSKYGVYLYFNIDFNEEMFFKQKSEGNYGFEGIGIDSSYQGQLPFNLDYSMTSEQIKILLHDYYVIDKPDFYDESSLRFSCFYFKNLKVIVRVMYGAEIKDNAKKKISSIFIESPAYHAIKRYNLKLEEL